MAFHFVIVNNGQQSFLKWQKTFFKIANFGVLISKSYPFCHFTSDLISAKSHNYNADIHKKTFKSILRSVNCKKRFMPNFLEMVS